MIQSSPFVLDDLDRRLLNEVQIDNSRPIAAIADIVGLSPSACYRRLQKLRDAGMIIREAALVDPRRSPWPLTVFVEVVMERLTEPARRAFEAKMQRLPQVMQCYSVSGETDFILTVQTADLEDFHRFTRDVLIEDESIKQFKSTVTLRCLKSKTHIEF